MGNFWSDWVIAAVGGSLTGSITLAVSMGSNERKGKIGDKDDKSKWDDQDVDVDNLPER